MNVKTDRFADLRGLIISKFGTHGAFAEAMDMDRSTLSKKLCGRVEWTRAEIEQACKLLGKTMHDVLPLFF